MKRVIITGAAGRIGQVLRNGLKDKNCILRLCDLADLGEAQLNEEIVKANICNFDEILDATKEIDCIVHLAGIPTEALWQDLSAINIDGTYNVFEAARINKVNRVIFASSNHAVGFYPLPGKIDTNVQPRPDTLYGVTKVAGEALGRFYADKYGISVACVRIGSFEAFPKEPRHLSTWISHRDMVQLVHKCITAPHFDYLTVYGVSANTRSKWNNDAVANFLAYHPQDNAEQYAEQFVSLNNNDSIIHEYHGGPFCAVGFGKK